MKVNGADESALNTDRLEWNEKIGLDLTKWTKVIFLSS